MAHRLACPGEQRLGVDTSPSTRTDHRRQDRPPGHTDAHKFAIGKAISLFTGFNLLHLLEKHGYSAKIGLQAVRKERKLRGA